MRYALAATIAGLLLSSCGGETAENNATEAKPAPDPQTFKLQPGRWEVTRELFRRGITDEVLREGPSPPPPERWSGTPLSSTVMPICLPARDAANPSAELLLAEPTGALIVVGPGGPKGGCEVTFSMRDGRLQGSRLCDSPAQLGQHSAKLEGEYDQRQYVIRSRTVLYHVNPDKTELPLSFSDARTTGRHVGDCTGNEIPLTAADPL